MIQLLYIAIDVHLFVLCKVLGNKRFYQINVWVQIVCFLC